MANVKKGWIDLTIEKLVKATWNYKKDNEDLKRKLLANIKRNGQIENIIVRELDTGFFEVVNGNHRYDVISDLNFESIHCFNLGKITEQQAQRIAIETNETRFESDPIKLAERVKELCDNFDLQDLVGTLPFDEEQIENMRTLVDFDFDKVDNVDAAKETEVKKCPQCGYVL
jgi:ParB-like chromosome segregation protein Spo0J